MIQAKVLTIIFWLNDNNYLFCLFFFKSVDILFRFKKKLFTKLRDVSVFTRCRKFYWELHIQSLYRQRKIKYNDRNFCLCLISVINITFERKHQTFFSKACALFELEFFKICWKLIQLKSVKFNGLLETIVALLVTMPFENLFSR